MVMNKKMEQELQGICRNDHLVAQGQSLQAGLHLIPSWTDGRSTCLRATVTVHCL